MLDLVLFAFGTDHLTPLEWVGGAVFGIAAFLGTLILTREVTVADLRRLPGAVAGLRRAR